MDRSKLTEQKATILYARKRGFWSRREDEFEVSKWRHYLESNPFIIKTDHEPLKYLLEQKLTTAIQKKEMTKLLGLDYSIQYRKGKSNVVADALSRQWEDQGQYMAMGTTLIIPSWVQEVEDSYKGDKMATNWLSILPVNPTADPWWTYSKGILRFKGKVYIGGLLQPLPIPQQAWEIITMDFIEGLPTSQKKNCILVIVDKFTKYSHFLALSHPYTATDIARLYLDTPKQWAKWLPHAEWWYNTTYHTALKLTPFEALYGYKPPTMVWQAETNVQSVSDLMRSREDIRQLVKLQLEHASNRMKQQTDKKRTERVFAVGDSVYLKLQPYRQTSLALRKNLKLAAKFYGPYKVIEKIGEVAYKLDLPDSSRLHPVFHVSLLKKHVGDSIVSSRNPPAMDDDGQIKIEPYKIMGRRIINRQNKPVTQWLVRWKNLDETSDTWEDYTVLRGQFPEFDPWGQGSFPAAGIVTVGGEERGDERGREEEIGETIGGNSDLGLGIEAREGIEKGNLGIGRGQKGIEAFT
ncbi:uncharacterized protein LOC120140134 [Hibiscus syriacus]|uniref:uncharacterized protein LOC120140134 n=1 Tax=Hibiscus syriacus TaxID=106335 RepID=UPI00192065DC|nr:uncharacterized protein LOC120140134 [Hibiscus syriacus]